MYYPPMHRKKFKVGDIAEGIHPSNHGTRGTVLSVDIYEHTATIEGDDWDGEICYRGPDQILVWVSGYEPTWTQAADWKPIS
ncbi:MAG: hypothetical protein JSV86_13055 [Gemmatimonadota bacterium]|nr:MAG: hypothetical protein JSV86_13055 [Gemmatimonadota bacterium]